jgi:glucose-6-phosphate 1-epimerase
MLNTDSEVRVEGLETLDYLDNLYQKERFTEQGDALTFESEVRRLMMIFIQVNHYIYQVQLLYKS